MADIALGIATAEFIAKYMWPRIGVLTDQHSILIATQTNLVGDIFTFHSGFNVFEIQATHHKSSSTLAGVQFKVVVPGKPEATTVVNIDSYPLSTSRGQNVEFDIKTDKGPVKGTVSFQYGNKIFNGSQNISVEYTAELPYVGKLGDTVNIAPIELTEAAGFTTAELKAIPTFSPSELQLVEEKVQSGQLVIAAANQEIDDQQTLLVEFIDDFVRSEDSVVIETYYGPPKEGATSLAASSNGWQGTISLFGVLELVGCIDPNTLTISAVLYVRVPIYGRARVTGIEGPLLEKGVEVDINVILAKGKAAFAASRGSSAKYELYGTAYLDLKLFGKIGNLNERVRILTLPF